MAPVNIAKLLLTAQSLNLADLQDLQKSGISLEVAKAAGIVSVPPDAVPKILGACNYGWAAPRVESLMAFPYRPLNGDGEVNYWRFKVTPAIETREGTTKYLQPEGSLNHVYCPPGVDPQGKDTLYIGEGEKKSYCLTLHGYPCIGLGGVYGWKKKGGGVIPDFDLINWKKRDVVIVFDADIAVNDQVEQAEAELAEELISRKARVFIVHLPYGPGCAKGADDFIVAHGKQAFAKLTRKPFKRQKRRKQAPAPDIQKFYLCGHGYFIEHGRLCLETYGKKGEQETTPLANFTARITEEISRDDGARVSKEFKITGRLETGQELPPAIIPAKDLDSLNWVKREWGAAVSVTPGRSYSPHLVNAIQAHSQGFKRRTVFAHTGWRKINGVFRYLHGGGAIGPGDPVEVDLGENLRLYRLPGAGGIEAAKASLRFLDIGPWEITAPLIACVYLAPFADLCEIDFSLWLYGRTGKLKSTLAALALSHYGGYFTWKNLPASWFSTVNSLEKLTFILKDSLCVIDDFNPPPNQKESHAMSEKAGRLIYQAGNRSSRGRLAPDLTARPNYYPRCLLISTGEMMLPGQRQSATARYLGIEFDLKKTQIDLARLDAAQKEQRLYPQAMAAYLEHLAPRLDNTLPEIQELWEGYRKAFQTGGHLRVPAIQAWLAVGFENFLRFLIRMGAISEDQAEGMLKQGWKVFEALGEKQSRIIEGERPTLKCLNIFRELFDQGRIYVESATAKGSPPPNGEKLGWTGVDPARNAELVGWADETCLYLLPETFIRVVKETIRRQGDHLSLGKNDLLGALASEGFIEPGKEKGRNTQVRWIQETSKRVMCMPRERLFHEVLEDEKP